MAETAAHVVDKFEKEWEPVMEAVREAAETFENLDGRPRVPAVVIGDILVGRAAETSCASCRADGRPAGI